MRLSLNVIPECPIDEIVDLAVHAEQLGFDRVWVYDEGLITRDVFVVMTAIAAGPASECYRPLEAAEAIEDRSAVLARC